MAGVAVVRKTEQWTKLRVWMIRVVGTAGKNNAEYRYLVYREKTALRME